MNTPNGSIALDLIPVKNLPDRFDIGRTQLYARLDALKNLGVKTIRRKTQSFITADGLTLLDELDRYIRSGGNAPDFVRSRNAAVDRTEQSIVRVRSSAPEQIEQSTEYRLWATVMAAIESFRDRDVSPDAPNPIDNLRQIQEACDRGWLLSTSQLAPLLGLKSLSGDAIERYGFRFVRSGKNGRETAWKITRS